MIHLGKLCPFHQIFLQYTVCPLAELYTSLTFYSVAHRDNDIKAIDRCRFILGKSIMQYLHITSFLQFTFLEDIVWIINNAMKWSKEWYSYNAKISNLPFIRMVFFWTELIVYRLPFYSSRLKRNAATFKVVGRRLSVAG